MSQSSEKPTPATPVPVPVAPATAASASAEQEINIKRDVVDRRLGADRRQSDRPSPDYDGPDRRSNTGDDRRCGLERRRGAGIRRVEARRSAEEGEMTPEQFEFIRAVEAYKRVNNKLFPTWTEVLEVVMQLGYRKCELRDIDLPNVPEPELWGSPAPEATPAPAPTPAPGRKERDKAA